MGFLINIKGKKENEIGVFLDTAVDYILDGKVIAFPTDSVYGLGGDPLNPKVVEKLYHLKFRDPSKGFLLLVADIEEAKKVADFNNLANKLTEKYWPGQLTLILTKKKHNIIPDEVTASPETIGLRIPENTIILGILKKLKERGKFGGIIGTSANYAGEEPSISGQEVSKKIMHPIDFIIEAGKSKSKIPTTIVDCTSLKLKILRVGKIEEEQITEYLVSLDENIGGKE
ncbi:MAG: threonylcarbamoyl-AMP synthase [Promethearchaeota archaeon]|nr:MAG: threonylcarbamoyl-AMP synthase [Candidatus Lokiarchaeota archaeon]